MHELFATLERVIRAQWCSRGVLYAVVCAPQAFALFSLCVCCSANISAPEHHVMNISEQLALPLIFIFMSVWQKSHSHVQLALLTFVMVNSLENIDYCYLYPSHYFHIFASAFYVVLSPPAHCLSSCTAFFLSRLHWNSVNLLRHSSTINSLCAIFLPSICFFSHAKESTL